MASSTASLGAGKAVLITGINGYIASTLGLALIKRGYMVRGTSRNAAHEVALRDGPYKPYSSAFQYVHIPDIIRSGAFDVAVAGIVAMMPLASPVSAGSKGLDVFVGPAVKSTSSL